jgi:hypothetical protein
LHRNEQPAAVFKNFSLNGSQVGLVNSVVDTLIPKSDTPGALDLKVDQFVLKMVDDCHSKQNQQDFLAGIADLDNMAIKNYNHPFAQCSLAERKGILISLETKKDIPSTLSVFYKIVKDRTIQGYTNSKYFLTTQLVYELVPGRYNGYFKVKNKAIS